MKTIHKIHRLVITIGFAATLTFTIAQPVSAACTAKEFYINAALATAVHLDNLSRLETRDDYMKSAYSNLAKAQAQKCTNRAASDRWSIADSWLGVYAARDRFAQSQRITHQSCRSLQVAEAREGLALSWLELAQVQARLDRTLLFQRALSALRNTARALSIQVPPLTANQPATNSYVRASVEASAHSSEACSDALAASE